MKSLPISVVIPTYKRAEKLKLTLKKIYSCKPSVDEIIIHIDAGDEDTEPMLSSEFANVVIIKNEQNVGPGGGRNIGIFKASNNLVASFDDDSYPIDEDYFLELWKTSNQFPNAVTLEAKIYHLNETIEPRVRTIYRQYNFTGCGAAYHKDVFSKLGGYIPKPIAYGIEEVDLCLRAYAEQYSIIHNSSLRVLHNTLLEHHKNAKINAGAITNQALLVFLRYPYSLYLRGLAQVTNRIWWSIKNKKFKGIVKGILDIPSTLYKYRKFRSPLSKSTIKAFLSQRAKKQLIQNDNEFEE